MLDSEINSKRGQSIQQDHPEGVRIPTKRWIPASAGMTGKGLCWRRQALRFTPTNYLYEVKWDGERIIAFAEDRKIKRLQNRKRMDVSRKFPEIIGSPIVGKNAVLDGEIIWIETVKIEVRYFEIEEAGSFRCPTFWKIVT